MSALSLKNASIGSTFKLKEYDFRNESPITGRVN